MNRKILVTTTMLFLLVSSAFAQPELNAVPGGIQAGNFVWDIGITPDLVLAPDDTSMALEIGLRLTGAPLLSATNINPSEWDTPNPGLAIFGWETPDPNFNNNPVGLQVNQATGEIFAAYGSVNFDTPGLKPFLRIVAQGPSNGGSSLSSTIEWLGVYAVGKGRIAQLVNRTGQNFDLYAGMDTQVIPEPASATLLGFATAIVTLSIGRRRSRLRTAH